MTKSAGCFQEKKVFHYHPATNSLYKLFLHSESTVEKTEFQNLDSKTEWPNDR